LGATWDQVTDVGIYTVEEIQSYLIDTILEPIQPADGHGLHWYYSRPPIADLEMEIDARNIRTNIRVFP
ncbi:MAG TPA: RidA family protein, partial [Chloroflexota bacterium]|nr:RidA family protein [Chloroflexota bacterium]